ncbi:PHP domain-containing protein [Candidatus Woesearchaeota archaeon]|nr:PHP domain-containing protein [Candidatus Woesearchaeota archaeon]
MKHYDLHIHTHYSKCSNLKPKTILKVSKRRGLDGIAITDHGTIQGALEVKKLNKDKNFEVIVGQEIMTDYGEIMGLYLKKPVITADLKEAVVQIKRQGGLVVIPHPVTITRSTWSFRYPVEKLKDWLDAIEGLNGREVTLIGNHLAKLKAKKNTIAIIAGSDAHFSLEIGNCQTLFEGDNLKNAIRNHQTSIYWKHPPISWFIGGWASFFSALRKRLVKQEPKQKKKLVKQQSQKKILKK